MRFLGRCGIALLLGAATARAQVNERRLTGHVLDDESRTPVPAVSVLVTGTQIGAATTDSGTFSLRLPAGAQTLTVRRIGYRQATVPVAGDQTDITIALAKDVLKLEAQVVTGVATTVSTQNAANAVQVINSQTLNETPAPTIESALQGKITGAVIQENNGGAPGGGIQIQVRGVTSINANASPLYVVDGVMVNNETINSGLNAINQAGGPPNLPNLAPSPEDETPNRIADINPEDIESIQILKGASASAIYGSKASSGVIIITTKKGAAGKAKWGFSQKVGHFSAANSLDLRTFPTLLSAEQWGAANSFSKALVDANYSGPQDYQSQLFSNPEASYESDLNVSGTQNETQYYLSGLAKYDNGSLTNTGYNKQSARVNVTQQFNGALSASLNMTYAHSLTRRGVTSNENIGVTPMDVMSYTPQFVNLNHHIAGAWAHNPFGPSNPFANAAEIQTPEDVTRFIGGGTVDWTPFKAEHQSLKVNLIGGVDIANQRDQLFAPPDLQVEQVIPSGLPGTATIQNGTAQFLNYSINLIHHYTPSAQLDATTSVGFVRERRSNNTPDIIGENLLAGVNTPTAATVTTIFYNRDQALDQSLYAQEQVLTLDQRLGLTAGLTAERSTNDGDIGKFFFYPRYSASFRVPKFVGFLDELKLRAAYGQSGTLPNYGVKYTPYNNALLGQLQGIYPNLLHGDSTIRPESETEVETGFDATLFNSRAQLTATVYQKRVKDLLLLANVAPSQYYNQAWFNGGEFTNQGLELSLSATPIQMRNGLTWISTTTFYRNYSVVNSLPVPAFEAGNTFGALFGTGYIAVGRSVSELVDPSIVGKNGYPQQQGDFQPSYNMSFGEELTFKHFRLYGLLDYRRGGTVINISRWLFELGPHLLADTAGAAVRIAAYNRGDYRPYLEDGTFVKLREVTLSYDIPAWAMGWTRGVGVHVSSARLSLTGRNLVSWFRYHGLDPEVSAWGSQNFTTSQDVYPYPPSRSYFISLDLGL
jgi:TonB-linked SusC/RagA family outer membrane protein